jgi:triosephosphate isomerase
MRRPVVAGNWKMNPPTCDEAIALTHAVAETAAAAPSVTTVVCPPTIWLMEVARHAGELELGAQTMHFEERGAFTGETSPLMLEGYAGWVILGHSERRRHDAETDERVGRKVASAVAHGLRPIAAIGEQLEDRQAGRTAAIIDHQVHSAIAGLDRLSGTGLVVAYEPVWAIGTGHAASPADAQAVAAQIREILRSHDPDAADAIPIQYGGSVTDANAAEFFAQPDIDGALVGGASLDAAQFGAILRAAEDAAIGRR